MPSRDDITQVILQAVEVINMGRREDMKVSVDRQAPLFGDESPLDSMGLVALLMEVEESCRDHGWEVSLSDERAMSRSQNPFRNVPSLADLILAQLGDHP